jgi:hypothetical protein
MSRKGNCWDNAVVERFFVSLKTERLDLRQYDTRQQAVMDVIDYIVIFYNSNRLHSYLGYRSPSKKSLSGKAQKKILCSDEQFRGPFLHRIVFASRCMKYLGSGRFISMKNRNLKVKAKNFRN